MRGFPTLFFLVLVGWGLGWVGGLIGELVLIGVVGLWVGVGYGLCFFLSSAEISFDWGVVENWFDSVFGGGILIMILLLIQ